MTTTMTYSEFKAAQQREFDEFPIRFAFNNEQLNEALASLGVDVKGAVSVGGGGIVRKTDLDAFNNLGDSLASKRAAAMLDDDFLLNAIEYELANHEYCITHDPEPALDVLGVSLDDERVNRIYQLARQSYMEQHYKWLEQQQY